jgi:hypothetical protein
MIKLQWPTSQPEWEALVASVLKANLKIADMNYIDLAHRLASLGVVDNHKNISSKIRKGRFSAVFFLQVLSCAGVDTLELPKPPSGGEDQGD